MTGERFRLVTRDLETDEEHVSSVVLSEAEAEESLAQEAELHELAAWQVVTVQDDERMPLILATSRRGKVRLIFARCYTPMHDNPEGGTP